MSLSVDIEKKVGSFSLRIRFSAENETLALFGASGCGKSMTLRCIAGVDTPDRGVIIQNGIPIYDSEAGISLSPQNRHTGLLFQNYALFPHMTVRQNIMCGVRRNRSSTDQNRTVQHMLDIFGLSAVSGHLPHQLSGGQQQRTALARILVSDPEILMLDEPFSALDTHLRFQLEQELRQIIREFGRTVLLVSHDRNEVYRLADRTAVMRSGHIEEIGPTGQILFHPETEAGCLLAGIRNLSTVTEQADSRIYAGRWDITLSLPAENGMKMLAVPDRAIQPGPGDNAMMCRIIDRIDNPLTVLLVLKPAGTSEEAQPLYWEIPRESCQYLPGDTVQIHLPADELLQLKG